MANVDRPNGFKVVGSLSGVQNGMVQPCISDADNLFIGDIVIKNAAGTAVNDGAYMAVDRSTNGATDIPVGVVVGFQPNPTALGNLYHAASTSYFVYVNTDPNVIIEGQGDGAGTVVVAADVGLNIDYITTAGSTTSGASNMEVDSSSGATTAATPLKIIGLVDTPDNAVGVANQKFKLIFNMHAFKSDAGTAGL